jgi:NADPH:quinone reductase-like Zn-dependent oxidoreductase
MKAIVQNRYGGPDVLELKEVGRPKIKEGQVLVKVMASSVNAGDLFKVKGSPWMIRFSVGFPRPKDYVLGWDLAGVVEEVGENVKDFEPGDEVFGATEGAFAEYAVMAPGKLAEKPANTTFEEAAAVPTAAITALQRLRDGGKIGAGQRVLITGASGGVGSFAVQIAKFYGAEVTGVCRTGKVDMVRALGADHVVDHEKEDFTKGGRRYDLILDNAGQWPFSAMTKVLDRAGLILPNSGHSGMIYVVKAFVLASISKKIGGMKVANLNGQDINFLKDLLAAGKIKPVVDRVFSLDETADALRFLDSGGGRGKVVIKVHRP